MNLNPRKILIINPYGIGDVLFTTPLLRNLKAHFPQSQMSYLVNSRVADMLRGYSCVDKIVVYDRDAWKTLFVSSKNTFFRQIWAQWSALRREKFDVVFDFSLTGQFSFLSWSCGIPLRVGFNYKNRSPWLNRPFSLKEFEGQPMSDAYLALLAALDKEIIFRELFLPLLSDDEVWAEEFLNRSTLEKGLAWVAMVPGGGASWGAQAGLKRWSSEKFAQLADKVVEKCKARIILLGHSSEKSLCQDVMRLMRHRPVDLCGQTTIRQMAALMRRCAVTILNDGGPLHVAVAVGAKTVSIFGPVSPDVYGPYPSGAGVVVTSDIACRPCYRNFRMARCEHLSCLKLISVEQVFEKVEKVLGEA